MRLPNLLLRVRRHAANQLRALGRGGLLTWREGVGDGLDINVRHKSRRDRPGPQPRDEPTPTIKMEKVGG